ncbi:MAG: hypothetical protein RLZ55_1434 [Actinomycetota bacterium]|jgi:propanol-preferring alcohol dehydrogenase
MQAVEIVSPDPDPTLALRVVERPPSGLGPGQLRIQVTACGVCRTDLQLAAGDLPAHLLPVVPGHQVVGRVIETGPGVQDWQLGERVGLIWLAWACGECRFCRRGDENLCLNAEFTGWDVDGGYAGEVVAHAAFTHRLGHLDGIEDAAVAPLLCGGVIGYRALRMAGVGPGSAGLPLGLYGFGASATLALQVARHWGAEVYVVTRSPAEVQRALDLGAVWAGTYDEAVPTSLGAAVTFAPVGSVVSRALRDCDRGAAVAINAIHLDEVPRLDYDDLWWERSLRSVANVTRQDATEFLALVGTAGITTQFEELALAEASAALTRLNAGDVRGALVLRP